jgi:hypothetical protein
MKIVIAEPPMIDEIDAVFNIRGKPVIFTWGGTIYNPQGIFITPELHAHEGVHYSRQTGDEAAIIKWWQRYLVDPEFRLAEELPAHRAEYKQFCALNKDRNARSKFLAAVSARLSGPLYNQLITFNKARQEICK